MFQCQEKTNEKFQQIKSPVACNVAFLFSMAISINHMYQQTKNSMENFENLIKLFITNIEQFQQALNGGSKEFHNRAQQNLLDIKSSS